jgi:nucleoside 2-deoxyribosyltransferase
MKIFVSHSRDFNYKDELHRPIRESVLNNKYEFFLPHEAENFVNTEKIIKNSDLILAEVSFPSTGEGIEIGWANTLNIPILCIYKEGAKISGSLKYITKNFIIYKNSIDLIKQIANFINSYSK